jgi:hypothetical protein
MQLLEYNLWETTLKALVMFTFNTTQSRWTFKVALILCNIASQPPLIATLNWWAEKWVKNASQKLKAKNLAH